MQTVALIAGRAPALGAPAQAGLFERIRGVVEDPNIVGFAIAEKMINGRSSGELGVCFHVRRKHPIRETETRQLIPEVIPDPQGRAVFTDVVEVGEPRAYGNVAQNPIRGGFSISHANGPAGTLSAIVRKGGKLHLLSAQHVFANMDTGRAGDSIVYPARSDGAGSPIGRLVAYNLLDTGKDFPNSVDAALAELTVDPGRLNTSLLDAARPLVIGDAADQMCVALIGRTSDREVRAVVTGRSAHAKLYYEGLGFIRFREQVACTPFGDEGDSGALVIDAATKKVVGLHIGGADGVSWFTPIRSVLTFLGASFAP
ncbi:MAG: hypothetical protein P0Y56_15545 [Candidatus Andeanibacterium colombiense]|uniref:Serine protease n=1 Tax=Candidatus Andeanibacterium colombiense TaxID=3121345 RepID=A0AAJ6BPB1_9SPHN|nr:MAG: hypothetical protein P0Y56_15545 [Sphingomonadaceae bacterium]